MARFFGQSKESEAGDVQPLPDALKHVEVLRQIWNIPSGKSAHQPLLEKASTDIYSTGARRMPRRRSRRQG